MHTDKKRLVLGCGALVYDLLRLIEQNPGLSDKVKLQCLPASWHNKPQLIAPGVDDYLAEHGDLYEEIYIAYADCGTGGALDRVIEKYQAKRIGGAHCYEFFAGSEAFHEMAEQELGTFYLTDYLVKNFKRLMIKGMGLDRYPELFDVYFANYKKLVYLAQTENEQWQKEAAQYAKDWGFEYEYKLVGTGYLDCVFDEIEIMPLANEEN
ncbi:MAG: DUF1638 domain-containing protein [Gammaproteobacteria bacterium]|nr:DUF1638 domain-containing protein [Gammaproteobacteria bacterium]